MIKTVMILDAWGDAGEDAKDVISYGDLPFKKPLYPSIVDFVAATVIVSRAKLWPGYNPKKAAASIYPRICLGIRFPHRLHPQPTTGNNAETSSAMCRSSTQLQVGLLSNLNLIRKAYAIQFSIYWC